MLALAQELGVDELRNACEDHVTSTLSVASACTFLAAAMDIHDRTPGTSQIIDFRMNRKRFVLNNSLHRLFAFLINCLGLRGFIFIVEKFLESVFFLNIS